MKLLFLTTEDSTFWSHRLALAQMARRQNAEVIIMTGGGKWSSRLANEGFRVIPWSISRLSINPLRELRALYEVLKVYRRERPDLVHQVALKPAVYGCLASWLSGVPTLSTLTGLGPVFTKSGPLLSVLRFAVVAFLKRLSKIPQCAFVFQNSDDLSELSRRIPGLREKAKLIRGFGIDTARFVPHPEPGGVPIVMLPARMLWEKGVREFVRAAELLRQSATSVRMVLVGSPDSNNVGRIPKQQLMAWSQCGAVEWWGHREDMPSVLSQASVICLPSYREGLPKILLEASACKRALIAADTPGCRECVRHGENGLLVPPRDPMALADSIRLLIERSDLRARLAERGREIVEQEFSEALVIRETFALYRELLNGRWPQFQPVAEEAERTLEDVGLGSYVG